MNQAQELNAGKKDDAGKTRWELIPWAPMEKVAEVYTLGAKRYDDWNWSNGLSWSRLFGAMMRHLMAFWFKKETLDPKDGQHHLASVVFYALALMDHEVHHPELDDRQGR